MGRGEKSLLCYTRSEFRLGGSRTGRAKILNGKKTSVDIGYSSSSSAQPNFSIPVNIRFAREYDPVSAVPRY